MAEQETFDAGQVSAVIPTIGRPSLVDAVESILAQTPAPPAEIVVAVDGAETSEVERLVGHFPTVRIVATGGGAGASGTRQLGVAKATRELIAYLDDDDRWRPDKLETQLALYNATRVSHRYPVVTSRTTVVSPSGDELAAATPVRCFDPETESLPAYLFRRRSLGGATGGMGPSTLLCPRELAVEEPWDESMRLHEDWEWSLRVDRRPDVAVVMAARPLVWYTDQPLASGASRPKDGWQPSLAFADAQGFTPRVRGDFLLTVTAGLASSYGERRTALRIAWIALRTSRPSLTAWCLWALQVVVPPPLLRMVARAAR